MTSSHEDRLKRLREKILKRKGGFVKDPAEWRPPQVAADEEFKAKAFILPPLEAGDKCATGVAQIGMDGLFFFQVGDHWIQNAKYPCPRVYDGDECPYCKLGFDLLRETDQKQVRTEIVKAYLPRTYYVCNIYFPDISINPDEVRGKVFYYAMPKTIFDKLEECISNDDAGDDPEDPRPWGIFYDPNDAYPLSILLKKKGDYNDYARCKLIPKRTKIAPTQEEIDKILEMRHDIPAKFPKRDAENRKALQRFVDALMNNNSDESDSNSASGFNDDESETSTKSEKSTTETTTTNDSDTENTTMDSTKDDDEQMTDELRELLDSLQ